MRPLVSIIIPSYNEPHLLATRAVPSVLRQTHGNIECIIVDDGSKDAPVGEVLRELEQKDKRIRTFRFEQNRGVSAAVNYGYRQSKGDYLAMLEQDDEYAPSFVEATLSKMKVLSLEYGAVGCGTVIISEDGIRSYSVPSLSSFYVAMSSGWLFRREVFFEKRIWYDEEFMSDADADFGIRYFEVYKAALVNGPLLTKYVHSPFKPYGLTSITARRLQERRKFLTRHLSTFEAKKNRRELAFILRQTGRIFLLGGANKEGRALLWRALKVKPNLRNALNLIAACCGHSIYLRFFHLERYITSVIRAVLSRRFLKHP